VSTLPVYYEARPVGRIEARNDGASFIYEPEWLKLKGAFPLSLTMPLSPAPVPPAIFAPWAANLLPEGSQLRAIGLTIGASPDDIVSILSEIGRDTAGALSIGQPGATSTSERRIIESESALERIIDELPAKPFLAGDAGVSMSLAGVQTKIGVVVDSDGRVGIPINGSPSTHILKPSSERLFGNVQNEALCLTLAKRSGLPVPEVRTGKAGKRTYFLIDRYDRILQGDLWRRLHQEDFCQALGKPPSAKYENNQSGIKGPTLADMFALTRNAMSARDVLNLLDLVLFNIIACNTDAHAKNYSILITGKGFALAPLYDVMCADVFSGVTQNLSQTIAGKNRAKHLKLRHWQQFARDCGFNPTKLVSRLKALASIALREAPAAAADVERMPAGGHPLLNDARDAIIARAKTIVHGLAA
jgi:serine/threonine-protein kinase HipA